jgi:hypothetical protein
MDPQAAPAATGSMRRRFLVKFAVWLATACASAMTFGPAGIVLCVSATGHVEIINGADDCCGDAHASMGEISPADCCDCVDTPLIQSAARSSVGTERLITNWSAQPFTLLASAAVESARITSASFFVVAVPLETSEVFLGLRSIVLLT